MYKRITAFTITAGLLAVVLTVSGSVLAVEGEDRANDQPKITQTEQDNKSPEQKQKELKDRLQKHKDTIKTRLTNVEKTRLQSRCKNSQGGLRSVEGRIKGLETSRAQVYGNLIDRLKDLSGKLQTNGVDTTAFDEQIKTLEEQIAAFKAELADYKQAVADLAAMDCGSGPEAFKAALEEARSLRKALRESGQNIKQYVRETIKPTLAAIRAELAAEQQAANNEGTN